MLDSGCWRMVARRMRRRRRGHDRT